MGHSYLAECQWTVNLVFVHSQTPLSAPSFPQKSHNSFWPQTFQKLSISPESGDDRLRNECHQAVFPRHSLGFSSSRTYLHMLPPGSSSWSHTLSSLPLLWMCPSIFPGELQFSLMLIAFLEKYPFILVLTTDCEEYNLSSQDTGECLSNRAGMQVKNAHMLILYRVRTKRHSLWTSLWTQSSCLVEN